MRSLGVDQLGEVATSFFRAAAAHPEPTRVLVDHLVEANLAGQDSHGVLRIPRYGQAIRAGKMVPNAQPTILRETPVSALIDGQWAFGQVAAGQGTDVATAESLGIRLPRPAGAS